MMCGMLLGAGVSAKKTYVDDVFSTTLYKGNDSSNTITTNIDSSSNDSLLWIKNRSNTVQHQLFDTVRGANKVLKSNTNDAEWDGAGVYNQTFTSTGFTLNNTTTNLNSNNNNYTSWTFRKAPGFFDVITYTGNQTNGRQISHNLGCVPGCIMVKRTDGGSEDWMVYHRGNADTSNAGNYWLTLNSTAAKGNSDRFYDLEPTATYFTVSDHETVNTNNYEYVAYLFAGGESTAATARSVDFDGNGDYLSLASDAAFQFGTGDFTVEFWWKANSTSQGNYHQTIGTQSISGSDSGVWRIGTRTNANKVYFSSGTGGGFDEPAWDANVNDMQWHHIAITRASGYIYCYVDGIKLVNSGGTNNITRSLTTSNSLFIGYNTRDGNYIDGDLSNVRIVKGTAVYTSSFRPPTEPLTNITNTTLLCCNNSSTTGKTVGGTITANGNPTASSDSPFDDPAAFIFGENEDQEIIKCGSYVGSGSAGLEVNLGFEPQWVMWKRTDSSGGWYMVDSMRGIVTGGNDPYLEANQNYAENSSYSPIEVTSTGFKLTDTGNYVNGSGNSYIYLAVRRSDGYVGKPPELGTGVFAMDTGNSSSTIPAFDSGYPVDFALYRKPAASYNWWAQSRLIGGKILKTNDDAAETDNSSETVWDSNSGWAKGSGLDSTIQSWMWKRHVGFDVVAYTGTGVARTISHSMNAVPQMMWIKNREDSGYPWYVYHSGTADSGMGYGYLDKTDAWSSAGLGGAWNSTAPTSTVFSLGTWAGVNVSGSDYIAMLFSSVDGVSSVGSYSGNNSSSGPTVTTGFSPRLIIIKNATTADHWVVFDTLRGISNSGNDKRLRLDTNGAQTDNMDWLSISSTGFTLNTNDTGVNSSDTFIYYAHA